MLRLHHGTQYEPPSNDSGTWMAYKAVGLRPSLFPQVPAQGELYMKIPGGFQLDQGKSDDYLLKLKKNLYGTKNVGRIWNKHLTKLIKEVGFTQSKVDKCVFYRGKTM